MEAKLLLPPRQDGSAQALVPVTISDCDNGSGTHQISFTMESVRFPAWLSPHLSTGHEAEP